jgi:hypothetical protein
MELKEVIGRLMEHIKVLNGARSLMVCLIMDEGDSNGNKMKSSKANLFLQLSFEQHGLRASDQDYYIHQV